MWLGCDKMMCIIVPTLKSSHIYKDDLNNRKLVSSKPCIDPMIVTINIYTNIVSSKPCIDPMIACHIYHAYIFSVISPQYSKLSPKMLHFAHFSGSSNFWI